MGFFGDAWDWTKSNAGTLGSWGFSPGMGATYSTYKTMFGDPLFDPAKGSQHGAAGARDVSNQFGGLANEQWNRQMGGLDKAMGAYGQAGDWASTMQNRGPGAMENYWAQNGWQFNQPTATSGALGSYEQYMRNNPGMTSSAYNDARGMLNTSAASDVYSQMGGALSGRRSDRENFYQRAAGQYDAPSKAEDMYSTFTNQYHQMLGNAERANQQQLAELKAKGRSEDYRPIGVTKAEAFSAALPQMQGTAQIEKGAGELGGYYRGASDTSDYYGSQRGALTGPGAYEQFVTADIGGFNPAMDRAKSQGLARINQEMARRGGFRSGAADTAIGNFLGEMEAREYDQRAQRAQQAQQMQLGRIGQGTQTAQASAQGKLAQGSALQGLAGQRDTEKRARIDQMQSAVLGASNEGLANQRLALDANRAADEARMARLKLSSDIGSQGNDSMLKILAGLGTAGESADRSLLARLAGGAGAAGASDEGLLSRLGALSEMGRGADASNLGRANSIFGMGSQFDANQLDRFKMLGGLAGQQDSALLARLMGGGQLAGGAQDAAMGRDRDIFNALFGVGGGRAGLISNMYGNAGSLYGSSMTDSLNALANAYGLEAQGMNARAEMPWRVAGLGVDVGSMAMGMPPGLGGGMRGGGGPSRNYAPPGSRSWRPA